MDGGDIRRKWKREKNIKKTGNIIMNVELKGKGHINLNIQIMIDHSGDRLYYLRQIVSLSHEGLVLFVLLYNHNGNIKPLA